MSELDQRPGWQRLRQAREELGVAALVLADPIAPPRAAVPHLRSFWRELGAAAGEAGLGSGDDPRGFIAAGAPDLDAAALARDHAALADADALDARQLRRHVERATALQTRLEARIGGAPLVRRRKRILWTIAGLVILFAPVLGYVALNRDVDGAGPWRAAYFTDRKLESRPIIVREVAVAHDWDKDAPLEAVPPDKFSVRWDTCLRVDEDGPVTFQVHANDGARVFVDGETVVDGWERDEATRKRGFGTGVVELSAGVHHLRVEYFESLGSASVELAASFDDELPQPLPRERLIYPGDDFDEDDPCAAVR